MSSASIAEQTRSGGLRRALHQAFSAAVTPMEPADVLDLFSPLRRGADLRARITAVRAETDDAATIELKPGKDWAGHVPGQYIRIGIDVEGRRHWRAYSLTHGPRADRRISITVKAVPDGVVSPFLVHQATPGTMVHLEQAAGEFVLDESHRKLLFVTAGSGITPVIGMLRNLYPVTDSGVLGAKDRNLDITVVHLAPSEPQTIFRENLSELGASGAITLIPRYDDQHGLFSVESLAELVPDLHDRVTYACGPHGLLDALQSHHDALGLPLFTEQFRLGQVEAGEGGTVAIGGQEIEVDGTTPILDAAEEAGLIMPSGCRMGICMGCVLPLREGAVRDLRNGDVTRAVPGETPEGGLPIQTCISAAAGACTIDHHPRPTSATPMKESVR
ncbi:ferredoxin reductase [Nocardioides nematodiphilus]|uniref:ferredoxin reductase n=1 Tax=Nocardioides nematodiphilus TaxID=2849669 RepID=UPI001CD986C4|nr:ferredoxin reductase [Nocardioides nematodiphilus]MCA1981760.1 ferredoxin reductase [Nocardioides nematodiphilus]